MRHDDLPVQPARLLRNPDFPTLRQLTEKMPQARKTEFNNLNVETRVRARSKGSTYIVTDHPEEHSDQSITTAEGERMARLQDDYIKNCEMILIDGYIGNDPSFRTPTRLIIESANANVAAMQKMLYFPVEEYGAAEFRPELTIIYTANL
ncbi:MAG: phosphoenolpyruvate carboxykinase (ATP), partial [Acidobacteriota bacterium]